MIIDEFMVANPMTGLAIAAFVMTTISTLVQKKFTDQAHIKHLKARQKELQKELKKEKDENILKELNLEFMQLTGAMMKSSFKPLFVTFIPFMLFFFWLRSVYDPLYVGLAWYQGWLFRYIIFSLVFSIVLRKVLKVE